MTTMDNPAPGGLKPNPVPQAEPSSGQNPDTKASEQNLDSLFFNIMPKDKGQGPLVEARLKLDAPSSQTAPEPEAKPSASASQIFKKYKLYLGIGLAVIAIGIGLYFAVSLLGGLGYKSENILATNPPVTPTAKPSPAPAPQAQPTAGFTTPQTWRDKYFPGCTDITLCGDNADPDRDGLSNLEEYNLGTDPNNPDSDQDGLADGDEQHVFGSNPLKSHTAGNPKFSDADYIKGGFSFSNDKPMTSAQIASITAKMQQYGLHYVTIATLGDVLNKLYKFSAQSASSTPGGGSTDQPPSGSTASSSSDQTLSAEQDRDAQRTNTIKNIEIALVGFQADNKTYPQVSDFSTMFENIRPYLKVATDPKDPLNKAPYVYAYVPTADGSDFTLSFYSEVANQLIKKHAADAVRDANAAEAAVYDNQRENDLENLRTALLLYSQKNVAGNQDYVFPTTAKYKTALVPDFLSQIPKDPKTSADYQYQVSGTFNSFTLKTLLDNPDPGTTGYMCNQDGCQSY